MKYFLIRFNLIGQMLIRFTCIYIVRKVILSADAQYINNFLNRRVACRSLNGELGECTSINSCSWVKWDRAKQRQFACFRNLLTVRVCCPPKKASMNLNESSQQKPVKVNGLKPVNGASSSASAHSFPNVTSNVFNSKKPYKYAKNKTSSYQTSSVHSNKISQAQKPMITISISAYTPFMNTTTTSNSSLSLALNSTHENDLLNLNTLPHLNEALLNATISAIKKSYQSMDNKASNGLANDFHEDTTNTIYMKVVNDLNSNTTSKQAASRVHECGVVDHHNYRIVGGHPAADGMWPWMTAIFLERQLNRSDYIFWCGGALISDSVVLTAAHCLTDARGVRYSANQVKVRLGTNWIERNQSDNLVKPPPNANQYQQEFDVQRIIIHDNFQRNGFVNDIALIKLAKKVEFNERIKCICLPKENDKKTDFSGLLATVLGWGSMKYGGIGTNQLQQVAIPIWNTQDCDQRFAQKINQKFMCAGYLAGNKDACQGDSGSPLILKDQNQIWRVQGIVSWGNKCAQPLYPGVYTRVVEFIEWIQRNIN